MSEREPTVETLRVIARDLGIEIEPERLAAAARDHQGLRPKLEEFRRYRFPYLDPVEPGHVRLWIENGGRSEGGPATT